MAKEEGYRWSGVGSRRKRVWGRRTIRLRKRSRRRSGRKKRGKRHIREEGVESWSE